jgi:hypothetical protein
MRQWIAVTAAVLMIAAAPKSQWPATPAGTMASEWVKAFASEATMRAFLSRNVDEEGFRRRSMDERLETWRASKKKLGALKLVSVVSSKPAELKAVLASTDGEKHEFTFTVQPAAPHKLVSITRAEGRHHGFSWLPGH